MFERLGIITFLHKGWITNTYSDCHIYIDQSRVLLKYDSFIETYISSENDMHLNYIFIEQLKTFIKLFEKNDGIVMTLKHMIGYHDSRKDSHTKQLHNFIVQMLPGTQILYSYCNDPRFMYKKENTLLIPHNDYAEYFLN